MSKFMQPGEKQGIVKSLYFRTLIPAAISLIPQEPISFGCSLYYNILIVFSITCSIYSSPQFLVMVCIITFGEFLKMQFVLLLGLCTREISTYFLRKTHTLIFIAVLFKIVKTWEEPKCLSVDERMSQL